MKALLTLAMSASLFTAMPAVADATYPSKPIEAIVPWPAGQELDIFARTITGEMSKTLGVPIAVINRPGGAGVIGTTAASRASPDGHTILFNSVGPLLTQAMAGNAPYSPHDFVPVGLFNASTFLLIVRSDSPFKTMADLEEHAKSDGKKLVLGHFGPAAVPTQTVYRMAEQKGWAFDGVTFSPAGPAQLRSRDADFVTAPYNTAASALSSGEVRAIVTFNRERVPSLPNVPTLREAGYDFDVLVWQGLFAPKGTPEAIAAKLSDALRKAIASQPVQDLAKRINSPVFFLDAEATKRQIRDDEEAFRPVMKSLGLIKP